MIRVPLGLTCHASRAVSAGIGAMECGYIDIGSLLVLTCTLLLLFYYYFSHSPAESVGGEHDQAVAIGHISHGSRVTLSTPGPGGREQEQRRVFEVPTDFAPMCTKLLNQAAIVVIHLSHAPSC